MAQFKIFGFEIRKQGQMPALSAPDVNDGAIENDVSTTGAGSYGYFIDLNKRLNNEVDLINKYRSMSQVAEIDTAIEDIVNESVVVEDDKPPVAIRIRSGRDEIPEPIQEAIISEFDNLLNIMDFHDNGHEIFRQWYIDGKIYAQIIVDEQNLSAGIRDIRLIDPRKIRKVRDVIRQRNDAGIEVVIGVDEYFVYNDQGTQTAGAGTRLSPDTIIYSTSGLNDEYNTPISYLHKAIKPANQLRYMEDAALIYTLSRAPSRRVFYIDIADMPKQKADQYMQNIMAKYKNKIVYDQSTGEIRDGRAHQCLAMDTKVPLLDGRTLTLTEISEEYQDKQLWAYSCDPVTGKFAPGLITWAGVARPNAQVLRITLDNGQEIIATPDHKFPVWNKNMVRAENLVVGDSMIPLYRKTGSDTEYEQIFDNDTQQWVYTHKLISEWNTESASVKINRTHLNHKITKIEWLEDRIDTGCLTIDGDEVYHDYHTFALDAGIYTGNSFMDDFWLPRRSNGRTTEIQQLPSENISGQMDNVNYFLNKLYNALNVPISRMRPETGFNLGRSQEITRDEVKFSKFIDRIRKRFSNVFLQGLRVQLILKGIITPEDWEFIRSKISFDFLRDNYFTELKDTEILSNRIEMAERMMPLVGTFYSHDYIRRNVLRQSEEEIESMQAEIQMMQSQMPDKGEEDEQK